MTLIPGDAVTAATLAPVPATIYSSIPADNILRFNVSLVDVFRHVLRRRTRKKRIARCVGAFKTWEKRRRGSHDWAMKAA